ncbi:hypothetical protein, partial [Halobacillus sp. BBL2006]|uniref:hypothetical protein n=1 Tax=Halobacillus sp. BBL2006 TaxID=1543706 RepID=UPI000541A4FF
MEDKARDWNHSNIIPFYPVLKKMNGELKASQNTLRRIKEDLSDFKHKEDKWKNELKKAVITDLAVQLSTIELRSDLSASIVKQSPFYENPKIHMDRMNLSSYVRQFTVNQTVKVMPKQLHDTHSILTEEKQVYIDKLKQLNEKQSHLLQKYEDLKISMLEKEKSRKEQKTK